MPWYKFRIGPRSHRSRRGAGTTCEGRVDLLAADQFARLLPDLVGALRIMRSTQTLTHFEVRPFTDKQIELVSTFADQAAIAIENVRLFDEIHIQAQLDAVSGRPRARPAIRGPARPHF